MDATGKIIEQAVNGGPPSTSEPKPEKVQNEEEDGSKDGNRASSTTAPSSPPAAERAVLSSDAPPSDSELSSLPSSPPQMPSPIAVSRKPTFSFLKRKRSAIDDDQNPRALSNITPNAQKTPRPAAKKAMTQMQIDLGGDVRRTCRECGMEYIPSVKEDAALHKEFCGTNVGGIELGRPFLKDETVKRVRSEKALGSKKEAIILVDQRSSLAARNKAKKVLEVVNAELNAADLESEQLWREVDDKAAEKKTIVKRKGGAATEKKSDCFKVFLHLVGDRCVGFCLAEKISCAFPVVNGKARQEESGKIVPNSKSSSISYSISAAIALLGISRIWTSKPHRGNGLAANLLECARSNFFFGIEVPKHLVAFSQPTESGGRLAERWFESETGWHVYHGSYS